MEDFLNILTAFGIILAALAIPYSIFRLCGMSNKDALAFLLGLILGPIGIILYLAYRYIKDKRTAA